ncbi:hypothetical protein BDV37DRAFT_264146 [Aspergillus pseudonomiae]|uniref:Uncharacterized protein n=1 Tax=Aspergillus pseudonomiae TaxID=1506151 RepID=A0A5N7CX39_9EURO|nr:uncharacterized protein BDV37DRAFT_264146 [Aspergillus pseudonomiae]KAE8398148.1 hypothetical protein BDV37DRAFT_264146 [Aspergillus pseudonomiae]
MICLSRCFLHFYFSLLPLPSSDLVRDRPILCQFFSVLSHFFSLFLLPNLSLFTFSLPPLFLFWKKEPLSGSWSRTRII